MLTEFERGVVHGLDIAIQAADEHKIFYDNVANIVLEERTESVK
jgi:hypothetical protein